MRNPRIQIGDGSFGVQNNNLGFDITGTASIPIAVEACTNLANPVWTPLVTKTLTNGSVYFNEPVQTNSPGDSAASACAEAAGTGISPGVRRGSSGGGSI